MSVKPQSTSNQSSKPCTVLQYPSRKLRSPIFDVQFDVRFQYLISCPISMTDFMSNFDIQSGTVTTRPQRGYRGQRYRGGLALLTRNSTRFSITMHSLSGAVNSILGDNCTSLNSRGSAHSSGTSPSPHQAVTWSLSSPFYNDVIHLTGVYIFPNEGKLEEFFHTLTVHSNHPCHEPHIYAGDFNAYTLKK